MAVPDPAIDRGERSLGALAAHKDARARRGLRRGMLDDAVIPTESDQARRAAACRRLVDDGLSADVAERWITAWEGEYILPPAERGASYWRVGLAWIDEGRATRPTPNAVAGGRR